jgi:hypothetical protein
MINRVIGSLLLQAQSLLMLETTTAYFEQQELQYTQSRQVKSQEMKVCQVSPLQVIAT